VKILHVNYTFGVVGGTESYLYKLIPDLADRGHTSEVAAEKDLTDGAAASFHALPGVAGYERRLDLRHGRRFRAIVHTVDPDLIHIHNTLNAGVVKLAAKLRPSIRYVHDHTMFCPGLNKEFADGSLCNRSMGPYCLEKYHRGGCFCFRHSTEKVAAKFLKIHNRLLSVHRDLKRLMVASKYMKEELERVGVATDRITINPYYTAVPEPGDIQESDPPLILALCRMEHPDKGLLPLLDALARIEVPFKARLVGTGKHLDMIRDHARSLGLADRVEFPGFVEHAEALDLMRHARVIAFPSMWNEPFGIVGLEAMARGKPVVAFDVGGVREWLDPDRTGILVPRGDVEGLASALTEMVENPARAGDLGRAGPDRVREQFVKQRHLDILEGVYQEAVG